MTTKRLSQLIEEARTMVDTLKKLGEDAFDVFDPIENTAVALRYLADLHKRFGSWYWALVYYNHGDTTTAGPGTLAYARRIVNAR